MRLVLASASPRRRELLARLGLPFDVIPSDIAEVAPTGLPPARAAAVLARAKARDVAGRLPAGTPAVVLGADTIVVVDDRGLGKPGSPGEAADMLRSLRGRAHDVVTAVVVVAVPGGREAAATVVSRVTMRRFAAAELEAYVATPEPYDKAGAYAVQGAGGRLVDRVDGCYTNVVGLPVTTTARLLRAFGLPARAAGVTDRGDSGEAAPGPR